MSKRTQAEIDAEYSQVAQVYGDRIFRGAMLQGEIKALYDKMVELAKESGMINGPAPLPVEVKEPEAKAE